MTDQLPSHPSRTTHQVPTPSGRTLAVDVTGPDDGPAVLFVHSAPGSRRFDPDPAVTAARGLRLVTFDRPGYGDSTALADEVIPSVTGHAADAAAVVEALDVGPVDVVGWSAGGRIAAALAAVRPDLVRSVAIVATPAPDDQVPWVPEEHRALSAQLRQAPEAASRTLRAMFDELTEAIAADDDVAAAQVICGPADEALLASSPDRRDAVVQAVRAGSGASAAGMADDIVADQVVPWGFDPGAVRAPTTCWYGTDDGIVSPAHGSWWAGRIPGAALIEVPDIGHLVITTAWADILDARP